MNDILLYSSGELIQQIQKGHTSILSRVISLIENEVAGYEKLLTQLPAASIKVIGITGPPGAGKSTLTDGLIEYWVERGKKIGVLCVDPSSPFTGGALLGDRIRMSKWYSHPSVFIRSLASRSNLGGLHPKIIEIIDVLKTAPFDYIIVETVGVGQNEVEIAGLADTTVVVLVPEAGDDIQTMKAGLMEIADIFVVNKTDRPDADIFAKDLLHMMSRVLVKGQKEIRVIKTIGPERKGIAELAEAIVHHQQENITADKKYWLLAEKAYQLISKKRMKDVNRKELERSIKAAYNDAAFNLYNYIYSKY